MKTPDARKTRDSFSFELPQPKSIIMEKLQGKITNQKFSLFVTELSANYIHYRGFKIENDRYVIRGYRAAPMYVYLDEIPGGKTRLRVEQEDRSSSANTFLMIVSAIIFVAFFFTSFGDFSLGTVLLIALVPSAGSLLFFFSVFYLVNQARKNHFKRFSNKLARALELE